MQGADIYAVLQMIGATHLHHANSVETSCTFLEQGGLLSRGYVEDHGLKQTPQSSDALDKKYGIWDRIFVDHVDIHDRAGRKKGPNQYGPVLFVLNLEILLHLPMGTDVTATRINPIHWLGTKLDSERWFQSAEELAKNIGFGDFDKMLMIRTPAETLQFPQRHALVIIDNPDRKLSSGEDAYAHAVARLKGAAAKGNVQLAIQPRICAGSCVCVQKYGKYNRSNFDLYFA